MINWIRDYKQTDGLKISPETNLIESGLLDSFAFVELILFIESLDGCQIDLSDVDPGEFTLVRGLCRIALKNSNRFGGDGPRSSCRTAAGSGEAEQVIEGCTGGMQPASFPPSTRS